jgi:hypothetical protein
MNLQVEFIGGPLDGETQPAFDDLAGRPMTRAQRAARNACDKRRTRRARGFLKELLSCSLDEVWDVFHASPRRYEWAMQHLRSA